MRKWFVNLFCIIGAIIGLVSLLTPWYTFTRVGGPGIDPEDRTLDWDQATFHHTGIAFFISIFIAGTLLGFLSPFGGFVQLLGVCGSGFFVSYDEMFDPARHFTLAEFEISWYIALLSSVLIILSMIIPFGIDARKSRSRVVSSMFTVHPANPYSSHINIVGVIGAFVCILAITIPWYPDWPFLDYLTCNALYPSHELAGYWGDFVPDGFTVRIGSIMFVFGALALFFTSLGLVSQVIGFALIIVETQEIGQGELWPDYALNLGMILAVIGMVIVLLSIIAPVGMYGKPKPTGIRHRLLTWGLGDIKRTG